MLVLGDVHSVHAVRPQLGLIGEGEHVDGAAQVAGERERLERDSSPGSTSARTGIEATPISRMHLDDARGGLGPGAEDLRLLALTRRAPRGAPSRAGGAGRWGWTTPPASSARAASPAPTDSGAG